MPKSTQRAFTLIELLVVISIIAILSAVGLVSYNNIRKGAQDAKIKSDLNAIKKAYESNYDPTANGGQGGYKALSVSNFADGQIPKQPDGTSYTFAYGPDAPAGVNNKPDGYKVTLPAGTTLSDSTTPSVISNQGTLPASQLNSCDPGNTLTQGLVGYWKMDQINGGTIADTSNNGNAGTVNGGVSLVAGKSSAFGNTADFNGTNAYLTTSNNSSINSIANGGSVTYTAWIKTSDSSTGDYPNIMGIRYASGGLNYIYNLRIYSGNLQLEVYSGAQANTLTYNNIVNSSWHFIAVIKNGNTVSLYVDNSNPVTATNPYGAISQPGPFYIGQRFPGAFFQGQMDEVRIYNRALSASEINLLYSDGNGCIP